MIPAQTERTVYAAETDSARFGISAADSVHLMTILRDTLYSDKVLAVIREYSANAWDAARGTPIEVALPTHSAPVFSVRDRPTTAWATWASAASRASPTPTRSP